MPTASRSRSSAKTRSRTPSTTRSGADRSAVVQVVFYGVLAILLALCVTKSLPLFLPKGIASHVSNDSEGYLFALVLAAWIEFVRPQLAKHRQRWVHAGAVAVVLFVWFALFFATSLDVLTSSVKTLNETLFALSLLVLYVLPLSRPTRRNAALLAVAIAVVTILLEVVALLGLGLPWETNLVTLLAEGVVFVFLAPLVFDVGNRTILSPALSDSPRWAAPLTWALLLVLPLLWIVLRAAGLPGGLGLVVSYFTKAQESFVGLLLICLYFAVRDRLGGRR